MRRLLLGVAVLLALAAAADLGLTVLAERRIAGRVAAAVGAPVTVDLVGWPVTARAVAGSIPAVTAATTATAPGPVTGLSARLTDLTLDLPAVLRDPDRLALTAAGGRVVLPLRAGATPFGADTIVVSATALDLGLGADSSRVDAGAARLVARREQRELAVATATVLEVALAHDAEQVTAVTATAGEGDLAATEDAGSGALALDVRRLEASGTDLRVVADGAERRLEAAVLEVSADGLPLAESDVRLARIDARLPAARITPGADGTRIDSADGTLTAVLGEDAANELWPFPGTIAFTQDAAELALGPATLGIEVAAEDGAIALTPVVPAFLEPVVADIGTLRIVPRLPGGAMLTGAEVALGTLTLTATGDTIVVPH